MKFDDFILKENFMILTGQLNFEFEWYYGIHIQIN